MNLARRSIAAEEFGIAQNARRAGAGMCAAVIVAIVCAAAAGAAPALGFIEEWPGVSTAGWDGHDVVTNPGTGGLLGAGDGYLLVSLATSGHLGTESAGAEYIGDWVAAGITHVLVWLNDVGTFDNLEIHFSLGNGASFWQYNVGFIPPSNQWKEFDADLTDVGNWTEIIGTGPFSGALENVQKVHLRHDRAPFIQTPDFSAGEFGIDHLVLWNAPAAVAYGSGPVTARAVVLAPPSPNPSRGPVALSLTSPDGGAVHLQILDAAGRVVRMAELPAGPAGARRWTWDGADAAGRATAPGVYRVRAWSSAGGMSRPLVRIR